MSTLANILKNAPGSSHTVQRIRFDRQATDFDDRAGIPVEAAQAAACELIRLASVAEGNLAVDIGAGTGDLGRFVIGSAGVCYIGLDMSLPMLQVFAAKLAEQLAHEAQALLAVVDADENWPLVSGSAAVVFFSRAVHLLRQEHVVRESLRVAHPGGAFLVLGRVRRSPESVRALLRREMQRLLGAHGIAGRKREEIHRSLVAALEARGCRVRAPSKIIASWTVEEKPAASLDAWRNKEGLAGEPVPASVQQAVLDELVGWTKERFGDLQTVRTAQEQYELTVIETGRQSGA